MVLQHAIYECIKSFGTSTTAHGVPRATEARGLRRLVWLLVFFSCMGGFIFQAVLLLQKFMKREIIVSVEMKFDRIEFPAVTVCNLNPYKNSMVGSIESLKDALKAFEIAMKDRYGSRKRAERSVSRSDTSNMIKLHSAHCVEQSGSYSINQYGDVSCVCLHYNSTSWYCKPESQWIAAHCSKCDKHTKLCNKRRSMPFNNGYLEPKMHCLCYEEICFGSKNLLDGILEVTESRNKRQVENSYELTLLYSYCSCLSLRFCDAEAVSNESLCLCVLNRGSGDIWPCYSPESWVETKCSQCTTLNDCDYPSGDEGTIPCLCTPIIKMCIFLPVEKYENDSLLLTDIESSNEEATQKTGASRRVIPKVWEMFDVKSPEKVKSEKEAEERKEKAYGLKGLIDAMAIRTKSSENIAFAMNSLQDGDRSMISHKVTEFVQKCSFRGKECSINEDFDIYIDPNYGSCFTFRKNSSEAIIERTGPTYGLRLQLFVDIDEYLPTTDEAGVRIAIHHRHEQPFPDSNGYSAPIGLASSLGIRMKRVHRLPDPFGDCITDGRDDDFIYRDRLYSVPACLKSCTQKFLVRRCGCGDPRFPKYNNSNSCPVHDPDLRECLEMAVKESAKNADVLQCNCKQPCEEYVYEAGYSAARWPSCLKAITDCPQGMDSEKCLAYYREEYALVEVFYESLNYESFSEGEAYGMPNLLSDFGGQLGLWMGVSVITVIEFGILLLDVMHAIALLPRSDSKYSNDNPQLPKSP